MQSNQVYKNKTVIIVTTSNSKIQIHTFEKKNTGSVTDKDNLQNFTVNVTKSKVNWLGKYNMKTLTFKLTIAWSKGNEDGYQTQPLRYASTYCNNI